MKAWVIEHLVLQTLEKLSGTEIGVSAKDVAEYLSIGSGRAEAILERATRREYVFKPKAGRYSIAPKYINR